MSYIARTGNLAGPPRVDHTQEVPRTTCTVITNDTAYRDGTWVTTATTSYRLHIKGAAGENLAHLQETRGNVAVVFTGTLKSRTYSDETGHNRVSNDVYVDHIGLDLTRTTSLTGTSASGTGGRGSEETVSLPREEASASFTLDNGDTATLDAPWPPTRSPGAANWH